MFAFKGKTILSYQPLEQTASLNFAASKDGEKFLASSKPVELLSEKKKIEGWNKAQDFRITTGETAAWLSFIKETAAGVSSVIASSKNGISWKRIGKTPFKHPAIVIATETKKKRTYLAYGATGRKFIALSISHDLKKWEDRGVVLEPREHHFDALSLTPFYGEETKKGILLVYTARDGYGNATLGAALFDKLNPERILWRSPRLIWSIPLFADKKAVRILSGVNRKKYFYVYLEHGNDIEAFPVAKYWETYLPEKKLLPSAKTKTKAKPTPAKKSPHPSHKLVRHEANPILEPRPENAWEALATFNSAALNLNGHVHLLYRAQGHDGLSVLGYASSHDGLTINERLERPAFIPSQSFDSRRKGSRRITFPYVSGGGWGGCEDPRLTHIEGIVYLIYVAFNGSHLPGVALTSILESDFLTQQWNWETPRLISRPGEIQKNWVIFPEKINGKFAILHGISPRAHIEYIDSLDDLGDGNYIRSLPSHGGAGYHEPERRHQWDNIIRGTGAPPLRTDKGWLVLYHAMDHRDPGKYKVGAMLLDPNDPEKIIHRATEPILEPEARYENEGLKRGVVYVCGAVIKDGQLLVYYGASDQTLAVATAPVGAFLDAIISDKPSPLKKITIK